MNARVTALDSASPHVNVRRRRRAILFTMSNDPAEQLFCVERAAVRQSKASHASAV